jgi:hypothetical protein
VRNLHDNTYWSLQYGKKKPVTNQSGNVVSELVPNSNVGNHENYDCQVPIAGVKVK